MFFVLFTQYSIISRILHCSIVTWPRPGFTGLSSIASSSVKLQRHQALLCKSRLSGRAITPENCQTAERDLKPLSGGRSKTRCSGRGWLTSPSPDIR